MAAMTATANRIHGQTGVEDATTGTGEAVAVGARVTELAELVWGAAEVAVEVEVEVEVEVAVDVDVEVDVDVAVFVGALVVEVADVAVEVRGGASLVGTLVGALVVRDGIGVREGSVGGLSERDTLGRFEPPPHDAVRTKVSAQSAHQGGRTLLAGRLAPPRGPCLAA